MFSSLWLAQLLSGVRTPWYAHPGSYVIFAFLFFIFGIWLSLQLTRIWRLRKNSFFYFARASIYLTVLIATFLVTPIAVSCDRKDIHFVHRAEIKRNVGILGGD